MTDAAEIYIGEAISPELATRVIAELAEAGKRPVVVRVSNGASGGDADAAIRIANAFAAHPAPVHCTGDNQLVSATALIWLSSDTRELAPGGSVLLHRCRFSPLHLETATARDLRGLLWELESLDAWIVALVRSRTNLSEPDVHELLDRDKPLSRAECIARTLLYPAMAEG